MPRPTDDWVEVVRDTNRGKKVARYINHLTDQQIQELEAKCIDEGNDLGYGVYWFELNEIIGASCGQETRFILVRTNTRTYHGYPVTEREIDEARRRHTQ